MARDYFAHVTPRKYEHTVLSGLHGDWYWFETEQERTAFLAQHPDLAVIELGYQHIGKPAGEGHGLPRYYSGTDCDILRIYR